MRPTLVLAVLIAIALPVAAPLLEAATSHCGTTSSCCAPSAEDCGMTMCAAEPPQTIPAIRATVVEVDAVVDEVVATIEPRRDEEHRVDPSPPPPTRLRLARLETLLI